jgi:hypothetical protein
MSTSEVMLRREFLKKSAAGGTGLVIGFYLPGKFEALVAAPPAEPAALNAWVRIAPDDTVTILIDKSEMGQGIVTGKRSRRSLRRPPRPTSILSSVCRAPAEAPAFVRLGGR